MLEGQLAESRVKLRNAQILAEWESRRCYRSDGSARAAEALSRDAKRDPSAARRELRRAERLLDMRHVVAAVFDGALGIDHVDLILRYATERRWEYFLRDEVVLVELLRRARLWEDARHILAYWAMRVDVEIGVPPNHPEASSVYLSRHEVTGEGDLVGHLGPIHAEIVEGELTRLMQQIRRDDKAMGVTRSAGERRAEALVLMASRSINATGATARPLFQIIAGADVAARWCETASGVVLHPSQLEPWLGRAVLETFLFDGPTNIIGVSRKRTFTGATRRAIRVRDRRCQHASGCSVPATHCDVDHITPWASGGDTSQWNGRVLCATHNRHGDLRDRPTPLTPHRYTAADEVVARQAACDAVFHDATAPPV